MKTILILMTLIFTHISLAQEDEPLLIQEEQERILNDENYEEEVFSQREEEAYSPNPFGESPYEMPMEEEEMYEGDSDY